MIVYKSLWVLIHGVETAQPIILFKLIMNRLRKMRFKYELILLLAVVILLGATAFAAYGARQR